MPVERRAFAFRQIPAAGVVDGQNSGSTWDARSASPSVCASTSYGSGVMWINACKVIAGDDLSLNPGKSAVRSPGAVRTRQRRSRCHGITAALEMRQRGHGAGHLGVAA